MRDLPSDQLDPAPDLVIVGNANLPRGSEAIEYVLNKGIRYTSGAQWLGDTLLHDRWVIAIYHTRQNDNSEHGGLDPRVCGLGTRFLIGGAPANFSVSARLGETPFFVVEADEYDTSYFDRRSKFVHYRPRTAVLNNLEYDHADIFPDLAAIQAQFHLLMRTIPSEGLVIAPSDSDAINEVLNLGCWTPISRVGQRAGKRDHGQENAERWSFDSKTDDGAFTVFLDDRAQGDIQWSLLGEHNRFNAKRHRRSKTRWGGNPGLPLKLSMNFGALSDVWKSFIKARIPSFMMTLPITRRRYAPLSKDYAPNPAKMRLLRSLNHAPTPCL